MTGRRDVKTMDLTRLLEDRVHLHGFECAALRALKILQGVFGMMPGGLRIEFWQTNNTNPANVRCIDCWRENAEVQQAYAESVGPEGHRYPIERSVRRQTQETMTR
jgi:hypothetical protein